MENPIWPTRHDYESVVARALAALAARDIEARIVGSYAAGTLVPPYSDVDVLAVAETGDGPGVRDEVFEIAGSLNDTLCVTIDPYATEAIIYSIHDCGLQVDWFVVERVNGIERRIWRGDQQRQINVSCRAWSSLLYTLSLLRKDDGPESRRLAARDLAELWVWLGGNGVDVSSLPPQVPEASDDLFHLIRKTAEIVPHDEQLATILYSRLPSR